MLILSAKDAVRSLMACICAEDLALVCTMEAAALASVIVTLFAVLSASVTRFSCSRLIFTVESARVAACFAAEDATTLLISSCTFCALKSARLSAFSFSAIFFAFNAAKLASDLACIPAIICAEASLLSSICLS